LTIPAFCPCRFGKDKFATVEQRPWVEQTELREALAKLDYALTRLVSQK